MTRETKIGLLVGLAFIIVIGILLSDHFRTTMEPPQATLSSAASMVRAAVNAPGTANPPIVIVAPKDAPPKQEVPTRDELNPTPSPVIPSVRVDPPQNPPENPSPDQTPTQNPTDVHPMQTAGADDPTSNDPRNNAARQHGEELVPASPDSIPTNNDATSVNPSVSLKTYVAQSGDSVSKLAAKFLNGNTRANRQAIIDANPSLQDDPDRVIVGEQYAIPTNIRSHSPVAAPTAAAPTQAPIAGGNEYFYTVQDGDSLWRIANDELGDPETVDAIKELNATVLRGKNHDVLVPGMRLRLPAKPVASAS